jgi:glyoxylase-like metal-dependent hydrolase (beta-lactamase superfamily II)
MKSQLSLSALLPVLILGLIMATDSNAQAPMVIADTTEKVADGVYVIPDRRVNLVPNIGIIIGDDGIMVVDTGMGPANADTVLAEVRKLSDKPIHYLAITHYHPEHGMGAQAFPEETRIIVPMAQKQELLDHGLETFEFFKSFSPEIAKLLEPVELVTPHMAFERFSEVDLGGKQVQLLHFGGAHTGGDMLVFLPEQKILFGGDLVLNRFFPIFFDKDASPLGWIEYLEQISVLDPAIIVPGHGEVAGIELVDQLHTYLVALKTRVAKMKAAGVSQKKIVEIVAPEFEARYKHWENPNWISNAIERLYGQL